MKRLRQIVVSVDLLLPEDRFLGTAFDAEAFAMEFGFMVTDHYATHPDYPPNVTAVRGSFVATVKDDEA